MSGTKRVSNIDHIGLTKTTGLPAPTGASDATNKAYVDAGVTAAEQRSNHTGTQPASTISDFNTAVRTNQLDQMAAPTSTLSVNNQRLANLSLATTDTDAPTWGQVKLLLNGRRKADVKVVSVGNITLSGTQTIDGVALNAGDRVLVVGQSDQTTNGIYDVASGAWARDADSADASGFATAWLTTSTQGTVNADTLWIFDVPATTVTVGSTPLTFSKVGPLTSPTTGYTTSSAATAAGGAWTVAHGLGSTYVIAQVRRTASPMDFVDVYVRVVDANTISVEPDIAFAAGEYTVMVHKVA